VTVKDWEKTDRDGERTRPAPDDAMETFRVGPGETLRLPRQERTWGSLLVIAGNDADLGKHLLVDEEVRIGRGPVGLRIHDANASRTHASVAPRGGGHVVRDLGSTNGTRLNGERVGDERELAEGDKILIGRTLVKFTRVDGTEAEYLRKVAHLVGTDDLTGLMSKHRFDAALGEAFRAARAADAPLAAMMMDMDGLKAVNDRHGHQTGAETISRVGGMIRDLLSHRGRACRFGGDEFSAYLPGVGLEGAREAGEEIRCRVEGLRIERGGHSVSVTISIGVAELKPDCEDAAALVALADEALYRAKEKGRNNVSD
jgi:diguanylate cyclase (GGDEF)-like protein